MTAAITSRDLGNIAAHLKAQATASRDIAKALRALAEEKRTENLINAAQMKATGGATTTTPSGLTYTNTRTTYPTVEDAQAALDEIFDRLLPLHPATAADHAVPAETEPADVEGDDE